MRRGIIKDSKKPRLFPRQELTEREKQILRLLCQEKTTKEIADEVFLSDRTIEKIRKNMANKLEVKGTVGLVKFAIKNGYDI
jgi:DNA-binding NarL/FixJ family response regulator